jgi:hypothetical protein
MVWPPLLVRRAPCHTVGLLHHGQASSGGGVAPGRRVCPGAQRVDAAAYVGCALGMNGPAGAIVAGCGVTASSGARRSGARSLRSPGARPFTPSSTTTQGRHQRRVPWASSQYGHRPATVSGSLGLRLPLSGFPPSLKGIALSCRRAPASRSSPPLHSGWRRCGLARGRTADAEASGPGGWRRRWPLARSPPARLPPPACTGRRSACQVDGHRGVAATRGVTL